MQIFDRPDFYDKPEFIDLMVHPQLRELADSLPRDGKPIIIDCGQF